MLAAAMAWAELASELAVAAAGYAVVLSELTASLWIGPAAISMTAAIAPFVAWLRATAAQAEQTAAQAWAAVAAYEAAFVMTVPPPVIEANRVLLMSLIATNFFGQNTPFIALTEAAYAEMWAQDAAAMYSYAGSSATATQLTPFTTPARTTNPAASAGQAAAVAQAAATPAGANQAADIEVYLAAVTLLALLQLGSSGAAFPWSAIWAWLLEQLSNISPNARMAFVRLVAGLPYYALGTAQVFVSMGQTLIPGSPSGGAGDSGSSVADSWGPGFGSGFARVPVATGGAVAPALLRHPLEPNPVIANLGKANSVGGLSTPPGWANSPGAPLPELTEPSTLAPLTSFTGAGKGAAAVNGLLQGIPPPGATGPAAGSYVHRYGFRHSVMARPPSAG